MKRIFTILCLSVAIFSFCAVPFAMADTLRGDTVEEKGNKISESILPTQLGKDQGMATADLKTGIVPQAIKIVLALAGVVSFGIFVYAGIMLVIAQGNEEDVTKAKSTFIWSLVGLAFITTAYALVRGIMQLVLN